MVFRVYSEKKKGFNVKAMELLEDLRDNLGIASLRELRILVRYDIDGISREIFNEAKDTILSEPQVDFASEEIQFSNCRVFATELLPGQFDQRADSAAQCIQILTGGDKPVVRAALVYIMNPEVSDTELEKIKAYVINPVESREAVLEEFDTLSVEITPPEMVGKADGFIEMDDNELISLLDKYGFAFDLADLRFCRKYFRDVENRNPTITELRMIDTYWSDHCRHTTFLTVLNQIEIDDENVKRAYEEYLNARKFVYPNPDKKPESFMDIATIAAKELKKRGYLKNLDESEEINACSIEVSVDVDGKDETYLVMFKNETHNHPTEIEPFGGAATCLGGAIRDPLSGRSYVYQAMRITGSGDPRTPIKDTLPGKLPQRKITQTAAAGYSSYGNQIGLATGLVREIYDESYRTKRMEIGAVVGAVKKENVVRKEPMPSDVVLLIGGRTGRDGCGGATGSSKAHTTESLATCGAEVQKGNPPEERKLQRLFRKEKVSRLIKRCNDFGAGGVSVAIGELAEGLIINLDKVPKKYEGLDGTELAISESQERMAVVVEKSDADKFIAYAKEENIEATVVAEVTEEKRLVMTWRGDVIVDIARSFLNSNGSKKETDVYVPSGDIKNLFESVQAEGDSYEEKFVSLLSDLNICSQKGLIERFDSTIGAGTVLMPLGGRYELTPAEVMAAKIPVGMGETKTATIMAYGFDPHLMAKSPFHGALYAVVQSVAKVVAAGGRLSDIYLTLQEYFKKLGEEPKRWGEPFAALLGAFWAQKQLKLAAIGGKDSMSGSFGDLDVTPTLVSFAIAPAKTHRIISNEAKRTDTKISLLKCKASKGIIDFDEFIKNSELLYELIGKGKAYSAYAVPMGGAAEAVIKMCLGNKIGFSFDKTEGLFTSDYGSYLIETDKDAIIENEIVLGYTNNTGYISIEGEKISLELLENAFNKPLSKIFPESKKAKSAPAVTRFYDKGVTIYPKEKIGAPTVVIPVFPGTNCEYDTEKQFLLAGAKARVPVFKNLRPEDVAEAASALAGAIRESQIVMIPGGFSGGDEPDGSGKFIAAVFRNAAVKEAVMDMLYKRDGLMLGICNGFQALMKLGLLPYGEILKPTADMPTLTFNEIGRHASTMTRIKVMSNLTPWFSNIKVGDIFTVPVSHGEGNFTASQKCLDKLAECGQIATVYVDLDGNPTCNELYNPNGSDGAVEGIVSADGRILGKMGHAERIGKDLYKNIEGNFDMRIFKSGVEYFS